MRAVLWVGRLSSEPLKKTISIKRTTYASITYQRDMEDPKYKDWVALEREYNELEAKSFFTPEEQRELDELKEKIGKKWVSTIVGPSLLFTATFVALSINSEPNPAYMIPIIFFVAIAVVGGVFLKEKGVQNKLPQDKRYKALCAKERARRDAEKQKVLDRARAL